MGNRELSTTEEPEVGPRAGSALDDRALDALYRDDGGASAPDDWVAVRAMIGAARASGFDEEPSPRIDALLLAAARQHARTPAPGWWGRLVDWMRPGFAHPALAGAAALVIVGGAAGVMYRRGKHQVVRPTVLTHHAGARPPTPAPDVAGPPPRVPTPTGVPAELMQPELPTARVETRGPVGAGRRPPPGTGATGDDGAADRFATDIGPSVLLAKDGRELGAGESKNEARDGEPRSGAEREDPRTATDQATAPGAGSLAVVGGLTATVDDATTAPPPPPPDPRPRAPITTERATGTSASSDAERGRRAQARAQAEQLFSQARTAARAKNCAAVRVMAARVRTLDAGYYREVFARDPDVTACL